MSILTAAQGTRSRSTYVRQNSATKSYGRNPATLAVSTVSSKSLRSYLIFGIPAAVLAPTTAIVSATLTVYNKGSIGHTHDWSLYRATTLWNSSKLTWNTRPTLAGSPVTVTKATAPDKTAWTFDVLAHVVAMQAGGNFGWELRQTSGTSDSHSVYNSGAYVAQLAIEYYVKPPTPTITSPADGYVVSEPQPILRVTTPEAEHVAINVQVSATQNGVTPDWSVTDFDDAGTQSIDLYEEIGSPALADGDSTSYRIALVGAGGQVSEWSKWAEYTYIPFTDPDLIEPPAEPDNIVYDPSPPIIWDFANQTAYRMFIVDLDDELSTGPLYDTGIVSSDVQTATPPAVCNISGHTYLVTLQLWDNATRISQSGVPDHVEVSREFVFELEASVDPVTSLAAVDLDPTPFAKVTWERTTPPDYFQIMRDDVQVAYIAAADALVFGDQYAWTDLLASPRREHTWTVRAVVNNETSAVNPSTTLTINPGGLWLSQPDAARFLPVMTSDPQNVSLTEDGETVLPINSGWGGRADENQRQYSGTIAGEILATELTDTVTGASLRDLFLEMRDEKAADFYLTLLDRNIKVVPFNMTVAPTPTIGHNEDYVYAMSFDFIEVP